MYTKMLKMQEVVIYYCNIVLMFRYAPPHSPNVRNLFFTSENYACDVLCKYKLKFRPRAVEGEHAGQTSLDLLLQALTVKP